MNNKHWEMVYRLIKSVTLSLNLEQKPRLAGAQQMPAKADSAIVKMRITIRNALDTLRVDLSKTMSEHDSYYVLFPFVVFFDELVQCKLEPENVVTWPLLQTELFDTDQGGEMFYDVLETLLPQPQTRFFVYEVFYFCLKAGFKGKYHRDPVKIESYKKTLEDKIEAARLHGDADDQPMVQNIRYIISPLWFYAPVVVLLIGVYIGLYVVSMQDNQQTLDCFTDVAQAADDCGAALE